MVAARPLPRLPLAAFGVLLAGVYLVETLLARSPALPRDPALISLAITIDLVVLVPLCFYLLVVRRGGLPPATVAPVFLASLRAPGGCCRRSTRASSARRPGCPCRRRCSWRDGWGCAAGARCGASRRGSAPCSWVRTRSRCATDPAGLERALAAPAG